MSLSSEALLVLGTGPGLAWLGVAGLAWLACLDWLGLHRLDRLVSAGLAWRGWLAWLALAWLGWLGLHDLASLALGWLGFQLHGLLVASFSQEAVQFPTHLYSNENDRNYVIPNPPTSLAGS